MYIRTRTSRRVCRWAHAATGLDVGDHCLVEGTCTMRYAAHRIPTDPSKSRDFSAPAKKSDGPGAIAGKDQESRSSKITSIRTNHLIPPYMSTLPRLVRLRCPPTSSSLTRTSILRRQPILPSSSVIVSTPIRLLRSATTAGTLPILSALSGGNAGRRWASSAAAVKEETEESAGAAEEWPERVLPIMSEGDKGRLRRQRNVGM
jgi:hypothetical protein